MGGCVANRLLIVFNGLFACLPGCSMNSCAISSCFTASMLGSVAIFLRAFANACGFLVISAAPASARYSRLRDIAKRIIMDSK